MNGIDRLDAAITEYRAARKLERNLVSAGLMACAVLMLLAVVLV